MAEKLVAGVDGLSETLLIPLWAKAVEYGREDALLHDAEAARMMADIDYDFGKFRNATLSQVGCCVRSRIFDDMARAFIQMHPEGVVVQLGAGLDARYERLQRPTISAWYDLDLPEVIALRQRLLPANGNHYLAESLFAKTWMAEVAAHGKPVLLLLEGVLMYFPLEKVRAWLVEVGKCLPGVHVVFDMVPPVAVGRAKKHDALKKMGKNVPEFSWTLKDAAELEHWSPGWRLREEKYLSDYAGKRYPWFYRLLCATSWGYRYFNQRIVWIEQSN